MDQNSHRLQVRIGATLGLPPRMGAVTPPSCRYLLVKGVGFPSLMCMCAKSLQAVSDSLRPHGE